MEINDYEIIKGSKITVESIRKLDDENFRKLQGIVSNCYHHAKSIATKMGLNKPDEHPPMWCHNFWLTYEDSKIYWEYRNKGDKEQQFGDTIRSLLHDIDEFVAQNKETNEE